MRSAFCAPAASGHIAAVPAIIVITSRRLKLAALKTCLVQVLEPTTLRPGGKKNGAPNGLRRDQAQRLRWVGRGAAI